MNEDKGTCYLCEGRKADMYFNTIMNLQFEGDGIVSEVQQVYVTGVPICFSCMTLDDDDEIAVAVVAKQIEEGAKEGKTVYEVMGIHEPQRTDVLQGVNAPENEAAGTSDQTDATGEMGA
jgi:hypothetical protein